MYLRAGRKKIELLECKTFKERFKSLKFVLEPIDYAIKIPNKSIINTYFFCQKVDICITDSNNKIIELYESIRSEKIWRKRNAKNIYYLPLDTVKHLKIGENLVEKEK